MLSDIKRKTSDGTFSDAATLTRSQSVNQDLESTPSFQSSVANQGQSILQHNDSFPRPYQPPQLFNTTSTSINGMMGMNPENNMVITNQSAAELNATYPEVFIFLA